eukprot:357000-Chlamydomonas_euryale.AAC.3
MQQRRRCLSVPGAMAVPCHSWGHRVAGWSLAAPLGADARSAGPSESQGNKGKGHWPGTLQRKADGRAAPAAAEALHGLKRPLPLMRQGLERPLLMRQGLESPLPLMRQGLERPPLMRQGLETPTSDEAGA